MGGVDTARIEPRTHRRHIAHRFTGSGARWWHEHFVRRDGNTTHSFPGCRLRDGACIPTMTKKQGIQTPTGPRNATHTAKRKAGGRPGGQVAGEGLGPDPMHGQQNIAYLHSSPGTATVKRATAGARPRPQPIPADTLAARAALAARVQHSLCDSIHKPA